MTGTVAFRTAIRDALDEELAADERVILFGEDVAVAGGVFATTTGLYDKYGPERVFDTPISELALAGAAFGSAVHGLRPVIEIMFGDFLTLAMDSLVNQSTQVLVPDAGAGQRAARRSAPWSEPGADSARSTRRCRRRGSWACPGLKIVVPVDPGGREGAAQGRDPRRQPGALLRAQAALRARGRGGRRRRAGSARRPSFARDATSRSSPR